MGIHIELINYYLTHEKYEDALKFILNTDVRANRFFFDSGEWYTEASLVLAGYKKNNAAIINGNRPYWFELLNSCDRRLTLSPNNLDLLREFDQHLFTATNSTFPEIEGDLVSAFLPFFQGQCYLHAASFLLNCETTCSINTAEDWTKAKKTALPLLYMASKVGSFDSAQLSPETPYVKKKLFSLYETQSDSRIVQAAIIFQTCNDALNEVRTIVAESDWQKKLNNHLFGSKDAMSSSHLALQMNINASIEWSNIETVFQQNEDGILDHEEVVFQDENDPDQIDDDSQEESICHECGKMYSSQSNLAAHITNVHKGRRYFCNQCPKVFKAFHTFRQHVKSMHPGLKVLAAEISVLANQNDSIDDQILFLEAAAARNEKEISIWKKKIAEKSES